MMNIPDMSYCIFVKAKYRRGDVETTLLSSSIERNVAAGLEVFICCGSSQLEL
jgi:hypothetical protein